MTRDLMIGELKKVKPFYNYDRYRDDQIFKMYQRYVINKTSQGDVVTQQETPVNTPIEKSIEDYEKEYEDQVGYKTCDICGARLDTVGTCPECLRGEEGMIDPREPKKFENLDESKMNPYEKTAKRVLAYSKKDPERILLYDTMVEYLDELSMEGVFDIPKSAPGFECEDVENVSEEEALFYFEQVLANTDLENNLHKLSTSGGNGHKGKLKEDLSANEYVLTYYENNACAERRPETLDDLENDWHEVIFRADSDVEAFIEAFARVYEDDDAAADRIDDLSQINSFIEYLDSCDWGDGSPIILKLANNEGILYDSGYTKESWENEYIDNLEEGIRIDNDNEPFNIGSRVAERYNDSEFNVGTIVEIKKDAHGTQYLVKWDYSDREDEEWLYGDELTHWIEDTEENFIIEEDFTIDDEYTNSITQDKICAICGDTIERYGNNAEPVAKGFCCDKCNREKVIPARLRMYLDK